MRFQFLMLRTWQYNRNTDSKEKAQQMCVYVCVCVGGVNYFPKTDLHIINSKKILIELLLKQFPVDTAIECLFSNMPKI